MPSESVEEQWDFLALEAALAGDLQLRVTRRWVEGPRPQRRHASATGCRRALAAWREREEARAPSVMHSFERSLMLQTLDHHWREHLALDHLRQGIHLRGYAQKNPKQEYKREAFELFSDMLDRVKTDVVKVMLTVQVRSQEDVQAVEEPSRS